MKTETRTTYIADDGTRFKNEQACLLYEGHKAAFRARMIEKIGEYSDDELMLGGHALLDELPFKAPWLSPYGAGFIKVVDVRRRGDNTVEFQLADERNVPYNEGHEWALAAQFYSEWPD